MELLSNLPSENMVVELQLQRETGWFEMAREAGETMQCIVKGVAQLPGPEDLVGMASVHAADLAKTTMSLEGEDIYDELQDYGIQYDGELRVLQKVSFENNGNYCVRIIRVWFFVIKITKQNLKKKKKLSKK